MKNISIKQMIENSNIPASLIRATIKQFGGFESFKENAPDVTNYGISGGFGGFIYYCDTCAFYAKQRKNIITVAQSLAEDIGENLIEMVNSFNCLRLDDGDSYMQEIGETLYGNKSQHDTQVANALAWFAAEEVCRLYCDLCEEN